MGFVVSVITEHLLARLAHCDLQLTEEHFVRGIGMLANFSLLRGIPLYMGLSWQSRGGSVVFRFDSGAMDSTLLRQAKRRQRFADSTLEYPGKRKSLS
jgi:hypothetical protein